VGARPLGLAFAVIAGFTGVEFIGGLLANSLTLIADAGHMLLDATALGLAWYAARLAQRGGDSSMSYGYHRFQVLAAFVNGLTLVALVLWILIEAIGRLAAPEPMDPFPALVIAGIGLVVNIIAWRLLHHTHDNAHNNMNVRAAAMHVLGDMMGSAAAIIAAATVWFTGWLYADPLLALVIAIVLGRGAWRVLRDSAHILLEGVPSGVDVREIRSALMAGVPGVLEVHHVHAWSLTAEKPLVTLHANIEEHIDVAGATSSMKKILLERFGIDHSTIQIEPGPCPDQQP
jgi:cobalt-zinc-cadmium efflux system protein